MVATSDTLFSKYHARHTSPIQWATHSLSWCLHDISERERREGNFSNHDSSGTMITFLAWHSSNVLSNWKAIHRFSITLRKGRVLKPIKRYIKICTYSYTYRMNTWFCHRDWNECTDEQDRQLCRSPTDIVYIECGKEYEKYIKYESLSHPKPLKWESITHSMELDSNIWNRYTCIDTVKRFYV